MHTVLHHSQHTKFHEERIAREHQVVGGYIVALRPSMYPFDNNGAKARGKQVAHTESKYSMTQQRGRTQDIY